MSNKYEQLSHKRKQLQADSLAPEWMSTAGYQLLLNQSYLNIAETPKDMYTRIARRAAELTTFQIPTYFGYPTWYDAFYDVMWNGWLSPSTPVLTNMGNNRGHPIACLTGDSWIHTQHEGGTKMEDLRVGDFVLTHKGRYQPVSHIQTRQSTDDLYELKVTTRTTPIKITGNHPVKTNLGWIEVKDLDPRTHLIATNNTIVYLDTPHVIDMKQYAKYPIVIKDGMVFRQQIDKSTKLSRVLPDGISKQSKPVNEFVNVTPDLAWAIGLWLAEGSNMKDANGISNGIRITMAIHEVAIVERFLSIIADHFGVVGSYRTAGRPNEAHTWISCNIHSSIIGELFLAEFGEGCKVKNTPTWLKDLPKEHLNAVIKGVYDGDGKKVTKNSTYITLSNPKLVMSLYEIGLKAGLKIGLQMQEKAGKNATVTHVQRLSLYDYKLSHSPNTISSVPFEDGLRYCPFSLTKLEHNEIVYDITVENDHSFSVAGVVVHNCSGTYLGDSIRSFYQARMEIAQLTQRGYGTSWCLDPVRPRGSPVSKGGTANGIMQPASGVVQDMKDVSQNSRRGSVGQYLDPMHPDFDELVDQIIADHDGWNIGWNLTEEYKELFKRDPQEADRIWKRMMKTRLTPGKGYMLFLDKVNRHRPQMYKDKGFFVRHSNLCCEILLMSDDEHSFTCVLSSMNVTKYDEWKNTYAIQIATIFLDAVVSDMLEKAKQEVGFERIVAFTEKSRALGLGVLGLSTYYQQKSWIFGDLQSIMFNQQIMREMDRESLIASQLMARELGEPEWLKGYGIRNSHRLALPPTKSTAVIMGGVSDGIMPVYANVYEQETAGGVIYRINPVLLPIMKERGQYNETVMSRIAEAQGSVQGEDWLSQHEKDVLRTAFEQNQETILLMGSHRQRIMAEGGGGQGQSLNLYFPMEATEEEIARVHNIAYEDEFIFGLYYVHSLNEPSTYRVDRSECVACHG